MRGAPGVYGAHTLTQTFYIGASVVAIGNTATHRTQIYYNGKLRYNWPISSGKPGDDTPDGSYLTIEKANPVADEGPRVRPDGAVVGAVHLQRGLLPRRLLVGRASRASITSATAA